MEAILSTERRLKETPIDAIPAIIAQARDAQKSWAIVPPKERAKVLLNAREYILDHLEEIGELISKENGKPRFEAIANDLLPSLEVLTIYAKRGPKLLKDRKLPLRWTVHRKSTLQYWPKGVVAVISPWNYPFSIPFGEIAMALLAGNAVIFKPSEVTPLSGIKIAEVFDHALLPKNLLQCVIGGGAHGAAIIKTKVDAICFTGSVATGKKVMSAAAESLTPVVLELGGKDPMIVLPDADLDYATSAALWGGFSNSGQACASVERILIHESIHDAFVAKLKEKVLKLSHGGGSADLGFITYEQQKKVYDSQLAELTASSSKIVTGGKFSADRSYLEPTIITNPDGTFDECPIESTAIYNEETFGPVVAVTKYRTVRDAIEKANNSKYGLLASVIGKDLTLADHVARQLECGSVLINEVLYTNALSETPWGGVKESGIGRVHSDEGLLEFVNVRHVHKPRMWLTMFKSPWWFPYGPLQFRAFKSFAEFMYRRSPVKKALALPHLLFDFIEFFKNEPRL